MSAPSSQVPLLEVRDLSVRFPVKRALPWQKRSYVHAVDRVNLRIERGETVGLVGESGCGKSTLARAILHLTDPTSGAVVFDGEDLGEFSTRGLRSLRRRFQMVFQDPFGSLDPRMSVGAALGEALRTHSIVPAAQRRQRIEQLIETVGLPPDAAERMPHEFSGGQRQRIGIARALAVEPDLIVADEATSALDVSVRAQIVNLLSDLKEKRHLTMLFVAHDLSLVRHVSDRIVIMYLGGVVETAPSAVVYPRALHPYTIALLSAVPVPDPEREQHRERIILTGDVPSPLDPPPGCRFQPRCWLSAQLGNPERCSTQRPPLRTFGAGHEVACHFAEVLDDPATREAHISAAWQPRAAPPAAEATA